MKPGRRHTLLIAAPLLAGAAACAVEPMPLELEELGWQLASDAGDLLPLEEKAERLVGPLVAHHLTPEGLYAYRVPWPYHDEPPVAEYSDALAWTSLWAVAEALAVRVEDSIDARARLEKLLRGLDHLARVSGTPGLLARTMVPFDERFLEENELPRLWIRGLGSHAGLDYTHYLWKNDNAKAQVQSWILALAIGLPLVEDAGLRRDLEEDLEAVTRRIAEAGWALTERDGRDARFGDLHPGSHGPAAWLLKPTIACPIDPWPFADLAIGTNALLSVSLARTHDRLLAGTTIDHELYWPELERRDWGELIRDGYYRALWITHYNNDFLATLGCWALLESDPPEDLRDAMTAAFADLWARHRHDRNPLYTFLAVRAGLVATDEQEEFVRQALYTLEVYPLDRVVRPVDHRDLAEVVPKGKRGNRATHALPLNLQPSSSISWKSDPNDLVGAPRAQGDRVHAGVDFLLVYWLYRELCQAGLVADRPLPEGAAPRVDQPSRR